MVVVVCSLMLLKRLRLRGDLIAAFQYLKGKEEEKEFL